MPGLNDAFDWGRKLLLISGRVDKNAEEIDGISTDIVALNRRLNKLTSYTKELKHQLDLQKQKNASLKDKHRLEIENYQKDMTAYQSELNLRLEKFKNEMYKRDLDNHRLNTQNFLNPNFPKPLPDEH